jgi:hypothetical protein
MTVLSRLNVHCDEICTEPSFGEHLDKDGISGLVRCDIKQSSSHFKGIFKQLQKPSLCSPK